MSPGSQALEPEALPGTRCQVPALQDKDQSQRRAWLRPSGQNPVEGLGRSVRLERGVEAVRLWKGWEPRRPRRLWAGPPVPPGALGAGKPEGGAVRAQPDSQPALRQNRGAFTVALET